MTRYKAGQIVLVDWRDALPKESNKRRPAIVVEDDRLFAEEYPNVLLVPITEDAEFAISDLSVKLTPTKLNGCSAVCYALSHAVTTTSLARTRATTCHVTDAQLKQIRLQIMEVLGISL